MEVVIEEKVPVYAAGLGHPGPWMDRLHSNGTRVMAVIGKVKHAQQVVDYGIDMIVAQGHDGGGHNSPIGTFSLIPQVVDAVGDRVPVIGAGGIRSEEHTSELQSLMRISYAVFCLQKKNKHIYTKQQ